ncbi:MAG: hypothetical protein ACK52J_04925 [bacterium]
MLDYFNTFCSAASCNIIKDRDTGRSRGMGFVKVNDVESLNKALANNGAEHMGRYLRIE